jgi:hypothetical protein
MAILQYGNLFSALQEAQTKGQLPNQTRVATNQYGPVLGGTRPGTLVHFRYTFAKPGHPQMPLVIVTDIYRDRQGRQFIRGLNVQYLTFPTIRTLLQQNCNNPNFSYQTNIKGNAYITSAFRQYKREGIRQFRQMDCAFLLNVLASIRTFDPGEVENIRKAVREQINRQVNPVAQPSGEQPFKV